MKQNYINSKIENHIIDIKNVLREKLKDSNPRSAKLISKIPVSDGKMIRGLLVVLGGAFGKVDKEKLINIAAALELLHLATLIHDDIIDDTGVRRGKISIHKKYDTKSAIFAGDYLFSKAYVTLSNSCSRGSIKNVSETIETICRAEIDQYFSLYALDNSIKKYFRRINGKCASLFSISLSIGAVEGNASIEDIKNLRSIGYYSGMAFQLIDDILDFTSSEDELGKPSGNDIKQGIYNLPVIYELKNDNKELFKLINENKISDAIEVVKASEGIKKAKIIAKKYSEKAISMIKNLPDIEEKEILNNIINKLLIRNF